MYLLVIISTALHSGSKGYKQETLIFWFYVGKRKFGTNLTCGTLWFHFPINIWHTWLMSENSHFEANSQNFAKNNRDFLNNATENQVAPQRRSWFFNPKSLTIVGKSDAKTSFGAAVQHGFLEARVSPEMPENSQFAMKYRFSAKTICHRASIDLLL